MKKTSKASILVVEDESIMATSIRMRLLNLGYTVCGSVSSGIEAIEKVAELKPDLVLMDVQLKEGMDGIEAAAEVRRRFDLPVIYLTAHSDAETLQRAKITEPFGYLLKPHEERELETAIEMGLYKHQMERDRERLIKELQTALAEVKLLSGLLPICASCKNIRDDQGYWSRVETYFEKRSGATFSHGICPDCATKLYPEFAPKVDPPKP
jgi:CheY-like chemotaxis protein